MPGVNCSVLGCGSCRRSKRLEIFKLPAAKGEAHRKQCNVWLGEVTKAREIDQKNRQSVKMKDPRILKYVSIALFSVELQRYVFTHSQQETTIAQVVQLSSLFGCFLRVLAFIFLAYLVIIPFVCLFSPLCKNDEEEAEIRGFTNNQHPSKESQQQTTRVDMLLYLSRKEFQKFHLSGQN